MKSALILEDSRLEATLVLHALRSIGYRVERQGGIKGAKSACHEHMFDLYIVDVNVQQDEHGGTASGLAFVEWLRPSQPDARIIVCSSDAACATEAERLGARFVPKRLGFADDIKKVLEVWE
jgi:ActR/RegA family two-component response regulator